MELKRCRDAGSGCPGIRLFMVIDRQLAEVVRRIGPLRVLITLGRPARSPNLVIALGPCLRPPCFGTGEGAGHSDQDAVRLLVDLFPGEADHVVTGEVEDLVAVVVTFDRGA